MTVHQHSSSTAVLQTKKIVSCNVCASYKFVKLRSAWYTAWHELHDYEGLVLVSEEASYASQRRAKLQQSIANRLPVHLQNVVHASALIA